MEHKVLRVFGVDTSCVDTLVPLAYRDENTNNVVVNQALQALNHEFGGHSDNNSKITLASFTDSERFANAYRNTPFVRTPGGSTPNMMIAAIRANRRIKGTLMTIYGDGEHSEKIREDYKNSHIEVLPPPSSIPAEMRQPCVTHVLTEPDGGCVRYKYPGTLKDHIRADMITDELIKNIDWAIIQGSTYDSRKLGPEVPDKIIELAWKHGKKRLLTMPTDVKFGAQEAERFQFLIPSSDMISANAAELAAVLKYDPPDSRFAGGTRPPRWDEISGATDAEKAANKLQYIFNHMSDVKGGQEAYITNGGNGTYVIVKGMQKPILVPVAPLEKKAQDIGAGDTFIGTVFAMRNMGATPVEAAIIASHMAAEKIGVNAARHPNPKEALRMRANKYKELHDVLRHNHVISAEIHNKEPRPLQQRNPSFIHHAALSRSNEPRLIQ
jgi:sugar/nucleoside kinase (ribokinase family)